jgi:tripartite-type tricarboxylate transporter receptor subunit TctC
MTPNQVLRRVFQSGFLLLASIWSGAFGTAHAQTFPRNAIRIVAPAPPGTPPDAIGRVIAAELSESEGWRVVVENRPGALQTIGMADVLKQPADGYSILAMSVGAMATPALLPNLNLRLDSDFVPVIKVSVSHNVLVVNPSVPAKSVAELVSFLKKQPGRLNMSVAGFGTPSHLLGEVFKLRTGTSATLVPYQQGQQRIADLLGGTTNFAFYNTPEVVNLIAAGGLRALAITSPKPIAALADVPTIGEQGFPDLVIPGEDWVGFVVKRGTPAAIVARLNVAINKALAKPKVRETLANIGAEPAGGAPAVLGDLITSQLAYWGMVVKESGIKIPQ